MLMQMPGSRDIVIYWPRPRAFSVVQKPWGWAHISVQKPRGAQPRDRKIPVLGQSCHFCPHLTSSGAAVTFPKPVLEQKCHFQPPQADSGVVMLFSTFPSWFFTLTAPPPPRHEPAFDDLPTSGSERSRLWS